MKSFSAKIYIVILLSLLLSGCGYTRLASLDRRVISSWELVEECLNDRVKLVENLLENADREFTLVMNLDKIEEDLDSIAGFTVLPGQNESVKRYLEMQRQLAEDLIMMLGMYDFLEAESPYLQEEFFQELDQSNQNLQSSWTKWIDAREGFDLYISSFPRGLIAQWLGFHYYGEGHWNLEALMVEIP